MGSIQVNAFDLKALERHLNSAEVNRLTVVWLHYLPMLPAIEGHRGTEAFAALA